MTTAIHVFSSGAFCWRWEGATLDRRMPGPGEPVVLLIPAESTTIRQWRLPLGEPEPREVALLQAEQALPGGLAAWEVELEVHRHPEGQEVLLTAIAKEHLEPTLAMVAASRWRLIAVAPRPTLWAGLAPLKGAWQIALPNGERIAVRQGRVTGRGDAHHLIERWRHPVPSDGVSLPKVEQLPTLAADDLTAFAALAAARRGQLTGFEGVMRRSERVPASLGSLLIAGGGTLAVVALAVVAGLAWLRQEEQAVAELAERAAQLERTAQISRAMARDVAATRQVLDAFEGLREGRQGMTRQLRSLLDALPASVRITSCSATADGALALDAESSSADGPLLLLDLLRQSSGRPPELEHLQRADAGGVRFRMVLKAPAGTVPDPSAPSAPSTGGADADL